MVSTLKFIQGHIINLDRKENCMENYELTFLVNDAADAKEVKTTLESYKGKITNENAWGKRALAYPIGKATSAEYFTYNISIDSAQIEEFKTKMNFNEKIIRYLLLKEDK